MRTKRCRTTRLKRRRRAATALLLFCAVGLGGCGDLVRAAAMVPIKVAETMAVETAKAPFKAAQAGADAAINAIFRGK